MKISEPKNFSPLSLSWSVSMKISVYSLFIYIFIPPWVQAGGQVKLHLEKLQQQGYII